MKKVSEEINIVLKSLVGIPVAIFFNEMLNIIISIIIGEYVRIDGGVLEAVTQEYMSLGLMGYGIALYIFYVNKFSKNDKIEMIDKVKKIIVMGWGGAILITILSSLISKNFDLKNIIILIMAYSLIFGMALVITYIWDKRIISRINNKIEEINNKIKENEMNYNKKD